MRCWATALAVYLHPRATLSFPHTSSRYQGTHPTGSMAALYTIEPCLPGGASLSGLESGYRDGGEKLKLDLQEYWAGERSNLKKLLGNSQGSI